MPKKVYVRDEQGEVFEVEKLENDFSDEIEEIDEDVDVEDSDALTTDEINALKLLAAKAEVILSMLDTSQVSDSDDDIDEDDDDDETIVEDSEDEDDDDDVEEKIIDCSVKSRKLDSKSSFGSISVAKKVATRDSIEEDAAAAWNKRYNGGK